jgi:hypothetical protein
MIPQDLFDLTSLKERNIERLYEHYIEQQQTGRQAGRQAGESRKSKQGYIFEDIII